MKNQFKYITNLNIISPCTQDWSAMEGDKQQRFCQSCNKTVYNFSQLTDREIEQLVIANEGKLCARITKDSNGVIQTKPAKKRWRNISKVATAALSLTLFNSGVLANLVLKPSSAILKNIDNGANNNNDNGAILTGTVYDTTRAVVNNATVILYRQDEQIALTHSNENGEYILNAPSLGTYRIEVQFDGFKTYRVDVNINSRAISKIKLDFELEVEPGEVVPVEANDLILSETTLGVVACINKPSPAKSFVHTLSSPLRKIKELMKNKK